MGLNRLAWRMIAARPLRTLLTIVGIGLGVGVLAASLTLGAALDTAVDRTVRDLVGRADLRVAAFNDAGLSDGAIATVQGTDGVANSTAILEHRTFLEGTATGNPAAAVTVVGIDPATYTTIHDLPIVAGVDLATGGGAGDALITQRLASQDGFGLGSTISLLGPGPNTDLKVVGIVAGSGAVPGSGRTVFMLRTLANQTFGTTAATQVDLQVSPGRDPQAVAAALAARMTEPYVLSSPADVARGLRASASSFEGTAALIAAIVLFVGTFLIINTLSMTVAERAREVGLLRLAGARRSQVARFVFSGALVLGILGSVLGLALGAAAAAVLADAVSAATGLTAVVIRLDPASGLTAGLVGLGITVLAAIEPAIRAAGISPVEALRARYDLPGVRRARFGWIVVVFLAVAVLGLVAWPPAISADGAGRAMAVYAVLLIATVATPFVLRPMARILGLPVLLVMRLEERLARGSLARDRSRTALTLGSLVVGLGMVVALGWSAEATRAAATAWLQDVIPGDEVVSSIRPVKPDEGVQQTLAALPGVARVTPIGTFDLAFRGYRVDAAAVVGADFLADGRLQFVSVDRRAALTAIDSGGSVILPSAVANRLGLGVGDTMPVLLAGGGHVDLTVAAVVQRSIPASGGEAVLVGWSDASGRLGLAGADAFAVRYAPDATPADRDNLDATASELALQATPVTQIQGAVSDALARIFGLFDALAVIAVIVAALGMVNTLTMGVLERVRELGLLRAIGMSREQ
ncbi:MAG TPA: FtsX-like permease family protein, partial [Candidatus Binatus sp.]|nr:FtsX-like permease family protein [Candidatus Binatus sp.]